MTTQFKRITEYSNVELKQAVEEAIAHLKPHKIDFYVVLKGIDAYMEQRKRKTAANSIGFHDR